MSGLFKSKKEDPSYSTVYDPFSDVRGKSSDWLSQQIGKTAEPYTGELVAKQSPEEAKSFDFLRKFTDQPAPQGTNLANEEIRKTMQGEYDPTTSPYYQAVKAESARNLEDTTQGIASDAAGGGRYWTGARLEQQGNARTDAGNALNTLLGGIAQQERQNRLSTIPLAQQAGEAEQQLPLAQASALQSLGGLPRELGQAQNEATYNEWLRQQSYPTQMAQLAQPYATAQPTWAQPTTTQSPWSALLPGLGSAAGNILSSYLSKKTSTATS